MAVKDELMNEDERYAWGWIRDFARRTATDSEDKTFAVVWSKLANNITELLLRNELTGEAPNGSASHIWGWPTSGQPSFLFWQGQSLDRNKAIAEIEDCLKRLAKKEAAHDSEG